MLRFPGRPLLLVALLLAASACSDSGASSVTSPATSPTGNINEIFTGTLALNGAASFPFFSTTGGGIAATLTTFTPDTTLKVGLWVGVWDGARCAFGVADDNAVQGSTVNAFAISSGNYCVRIYDSNGNVPQTETFQIDVTHP